MPRVYYPRAAAILTVLLDDFSAVGGTSIVDITAGPIDLEWKRNSYREADTFRVTLDYRDLPLDPRAVRSILVTLLCADVGAPDGQLAEDEHVVFLGYADEPSVALDAGREVVVLEGRDHTGVFLDTKWPGTAIDVSGSLADAVAQVLANVPGFESMTTAFSQSVLGATVGSAGKTKWSPQSSDDCWTVLSELCSLAGAIPVVEFDRLLILSASDFSGRKAAETGLERTFGGHGAVFAYGDNIERLTWRRKMNETRSAQVEIRCWNPAIREVRTATWPLTPIVTAKRLDKDGKAAVETAPLHRYPVVGAYTLPELQALAKNVYEELARDQFEGELETREMVDLDEGTPLPMLGNGDIVTVRWAGLPAAIESMSPAEAVAWLSSGAQGLEPAAAQALVLSWGKAKTLASTFYVKEVSHRWTRADGYSATVRFINALGVGGTT